MKTVLLASLRAYRFLLSPWLGNACRYWPSCSTFAEEALQKHGVCRGVLLAAARLARCHPWAQGGVDVVPETFSWRCLCGSSCAGSSGVSKKIVKS